MEKEHFSKLNDLFLTRSQSKNLKKIGIDLKDAKGKFSRQLTNWDGSECDKRNSWWALYSNSPFAVMDFESFDEIETLSFEEIIKMLPKSLDIDGETYFLSIKFGNRNCICYEDSRNNPYKSFEFENESYLNSAYEMLIWLIEEKHYK